MTLFHACFRIITVALLCFMVSSAKDARWGYDFYLYDAEISNMTFTNPQLGLLAGTDYLASIYIEELNTNGTYVFSPDLSQYVHSRGGAPFISPHSLQSWRYWNQDRMVFQQNQWLIPFCTFSDGLGGTFEILSGRVQSAASTLYTLNSHCANIQLVDRGFVEQSDHHVYTYATDATNMQTGYSIGGIEIAPTQGKWLLCHWLTLLQEENMLAHALWTPVAADKLNNIIVTQLDYGPANSSPIEMVLINSQSGHVALSLDAFETYGVVEIMTSLESWPNVDGTCQNDGVTALVQTYDRTVIATPKGLVQWFYTDPENPSLLYDGCIDLLAITPMTVDTPLYPELLKVIFVTNDVDLHISEQNNGEYVTLEALDADENSLQDAFAASHGWGDSPAILSVTFRTGFPERIYVLVRIDTDFTVLYMYIHDANDPSSRRWTSCFRFPSTLDVLPTALASDDPTAAVMQVSATRVTERSSGDTALQLSGMIAARQSTAPMYVWGNMLLHGFDVNSAWYVLFACSIDSRTECTSIVSLTTPSTAAAYAFVTDNSEVWFGQGHALIQLTAAMSGLSHLPTFSGGNVLSLVSANLGDAVTGLKHTDVDLVGDVYNYVVTNQQRCPYYSFSFDAPFDNTYTRGALGDVTRLDQTALPSIVYLDYGMTYTLTMNVVLPAGDAQVSFTSASDLVYVSNPDQVIGVRKIGSQSTVVTVDDSVLNHTMHAVTFELFEKMPNVYVQSAPNANLVATGVNFGVAADNWACSLQDVDDSGVSMLRSNTLNVLIGCPPNRELYFNAALSKHVYESCNEGEFNIPCVSFTFILSPVLQLIDLVTESNEIFADLFNFQIIGGGRTYDTVELYTEAEIEDYNGGGNSIYILEKTASKNSDVFDVDTSLTWVCGIGSPCAQIGPDGFNSPEYYFLVRFSTVGASENTYCDLSTEFVLRLHGLEMDYITLSSIAGACVGILLTAAMIGYLLMFPKYQKHQQKIWALHPAKHHFYRPKHTKTE